MRNITDHKLDGLNDVLSVIATDETGPGGANHSYEIDIAPGTPSAEFPHCALHFQNGTIGESGVNGISNEVLIAVVLDRMRGFQYGRKVGGTFDESIRGKYACRENAIALTHLEDALMWLQKRTRDRLARGVEGTHKI